MSTGLLAILDDVAAIAKAAAVALDDASVQALKAGKKAAGIVIDDAAVTPRYVVGFAAERELPIVGKIAWGSIKNKLLYLLPGALLLSAFAPWLITPLLMLGGAYLCYEGFEKVLTLWHGEDAAQASAAIPEEGTPQEIEDRKVASAIRTDFILSAEIMAISLAAVTTPGFVAKALVLGIVAIMVTVAVYGSVALIVKADDAGLNLAQRGRLAATRALGRGIVASMPGLLKTLSIVGMIAMLWVGGGIVLHGMEEYGLGHIPKGIHAWAAGLGQTFGPLAAFMTWFFDATVAAIVGIVLGAIVAAGVGLVAPGKKAHA